MKQAGCIIVVSEPQDINGLDACHVVTADQYLEGADHVHDAASTIINLCRSCSYGSKGYYVSLLADARGQSVMPTVQVMAGLAEPYAAFRALQEAGVPVIDAAEMTVRRRAAEARHGAVQTLETGGHFPLPYVRNGDGWNLAADEQVAETLVYLGRAADERFQRVASAVFAEWSAPLLRIQLVLDEGQWKVAGIAAAAPQELGTAERRELLRALREQAMHGRRLTRRRDTVRAALAVLVDVDNPFSPSTPQTIDRLERVAASMNVHVARLGLHELRRLPEYDALFVRAHTGVTQQAFQFAVRAQALGMPVIDAPQSTIRCTNKVYLEELLRREGVPTPRTQIITATTPWQTLEQLGFPFVLKLPDGDFSAAVHKITSREEFECHAQEMFCSSPLLIAQEWLPTDFDWRIGVIGGELLFAARYYMARGHWQIRTVEKGTERYGRVQAVPRAEAPKEVVETALRAARLVGDGFYGVDLKEGPHGPVVIEVNDNPNLDAGYEDTADGDRIYQDIVQHFLDRIESSVGTAAAQTPSREALELRDIRAPVAAPHPRPPTYEFFGVTGLELEYPIVDRDLNVVALVEPAFRILAGRGTSDVDLGAIGFSNEFADHVLEVKTQQPLESMNDIEQLLYEGVQRFNAVLRDEFDARLFPTGMHPWFNPHDARLWTRSGLRVYTTYARLFNVRTHGWMNVQASHVNLPFGDERETMAMLNAASLLIPYLPAIAASSPMFDGKLQPDVDSRMAFLTRIQARVPESCGSMVPEYSHSFTDYRRNVLQPMYAALDRMPDTSCIRHEFFNTRAAILRFMRKAMEVRVLDTQECVKMDVAIATFVRWALKHLTTELMQGRLALPEHPVLVSDFNRTISLGSEANVRAPFLPVDRNEFGEAPVKLVLRQLLDGARAHAPADDGKYLNLVERVIENGSLAERIRARLLPYADKPTQELKEAARHCYIQLADCLESNEPWEQRWI